MWEGLDREPSDVASFDEVLAETTTLLDGSGIDYALMGGIAATAFGGCRYTHDVDVFVRRQDAERVLALFGAQGFQTETTDPHWLYKAHKREILVDIIFRSAGSVFLDDEMVERAPRLPFRGQSVRVIPPEDLFVIKALVLNENTLAVDSHVMRHLTDLLGILRARELDWDYLLKRARFGPRRVLGLLVYAQSLDLHVPPRVVKALVQLLEIC